MDSGDIAQDKANNKIKYGCLGAIAIPAVMMIFSGVTDESPLSIVIVIALAWFAYLIYVNLYFHGNKFDTLKQGIKKYTNECNDLNDHINSLKSSYSEIKSVDYGDSKLHDDSAYNMRRKEWANQSSGSRTHNCSSSVVKNANNQPFKYLCKYFNIKNNEETLSIFEEVLNNFAAAEQGKSLLVRERDAIVSTISNSIPSLIMQFHRERVIRELGFKPIDLSDLYFPVYTFQYISAGGNSSSKCPIQLNVPNLDRFVIYLSELVKFRNSVAGQRALMTSRLREEIKHRDNFTCKICNLSVTQEKNLLLEIDHIVPLSKGGITSHENLQVLCWRCNRSKGAKIISAQPLNQ